ncbi:MAG: ABC transporter permease [Sphingobacteriia bacterium]|nr:ABC transporter permease [Sphingobacteriia bacterium]
MSRLRFKAIVYKEFIHIKRDKPSLAIAFMMPLMLLFLFGYAVTTDVENIDLVVYDQSRSQASLELIENFTQSGVFIFKEYAASMDEVESALDSGNSRTALVIPPNYHNDIYRIQGPEVQILVDGSDPMIARTAMNSALIIGQNMNIQMIGQSGGQSSGRGISFQPRVWYNPEMKSLNFNIPALIGLILQNITVMLTAFTLVRERERGTLEQLIVTPIKPVELMAGKLVPYIAIAAIDVVVALGVNTLWFGVPVQGSFVLLILLSTIFLVAALGIGLLISTIAKTQLQAMQATIAFLLPSILLSGFMFPREAMPEIIQALGMLIPLTYFLEILRGIIVKGVGLSHLWQQALILSIFSAGIITIASIKFQKNMD